MLFPTWKPELVLHDSKPLLEIAAIEDSGVDESEFRRLIFSGYVSLFGDISCFIYSLTSFIRHIRLI